MPYEYLWPSSFVHSLVSHFGDASLSERQVAGLILMTTAIIYGTEQVVEEDGEEGAFNEGHMKWHDALYFTVVTLSTVG